MWIVALVLVCGLTLFANLGARDFWKADESRHAQRAREVLASGRWWTPTYLGRQSFDKHPIHIWLMAGSGLLLGGPPETAFRLPMASAGLASVLFTFALGTRLFGPRAGGMAGFVLATTFLIVYHARAAFIDLPLLACITGAILFGHRALDASRPHAGDAALAVVCLVVGTAAKGPVGLVLPLLVLGASGAASARWRIIVWIALLSAVAVVPLYLAIGYEFTSRFLIRDNLLRFLKPEPSLGGDHPAYFYVLTLAGNFLPWTFLLPALGAAIASTPGAWRRWRLPLIWFGMMFVLLSLAANKREPYLLPLLPALALLVGAAADDLRAGRAPACVVRWWRGGLIGLGGAFGLAGLILPFLWPAPLGEVAWGPGGTALAAVAAWVVIQSRYPAHPRTAVAAGALVLVGMAVLVWSLLPAMNRTRSARLAAATLRAAAGSAPIAVLEGVHAGLVYYMGFSHPAEASVAPAEVASALRAGRLILVGPGGLQRVQLPAGEAVNVRSRVWIGKDEYLLLERAAADQTTGKHVTKERSEFIVEREAFRVHCSLFIVHRQKTAGLGERSFNRQL